MNEIEDIDKNVFLQNCFFSGASIPKSLIFFEFILIVSPSITLAIPVIFSISCDFKWAQNIKGNINKKLSG